MGCPCFRTRTGTDYGWVDDLEPLVHVLFFRHQSELEVVPQVGLQV